MKKTVISKFRKKCLKLRENDLSPAEYNMRDINERVYRAMMKMGKSRVDVAELYGMDTTIPLAMQPPEKVPRPTMENVVRLSRFLGVSVRWMLYGDPENDVDRFVVGDTSDSRQTRGSVSHGAAIIAGATNSTVVVQNIKADGLSDLERAVLQALRTLPPRDQASVMSYIFALEKESLDNQGN